MGSWGLPPNAVEVPGASDAGGTGVVPPEGAGVVVPEVDAGVVTVEEVLVEVEAAEEVGAVFS